MGHYTNLVKKTLKESREFDRSLIYGSPNEQTPGEEHRSEHPDEPDDKEDDDSYGYKKVLAKQPKRHADLDEKTKVIPYIKKSRKLT